MTMKCSILDPKVDYIFKQIFGQDNENCRRLLLKLLNSIFERKSSIIVKSIEYVNPYLDKEYNDDKQSILDIRVKTQNDESIDIEMQVASSPYYIKRSLWYWASMYEKQLESAESYGTLNRCIVVNLLNFNLDITKEISDYHNVFEVKERFNNLKLTDDLEMHFVEMKKLQECGIENLDDLSKWVTFFNDANDENKSGVVEKLRQEMEEIDMAADILQRVSQDERERAKYDSRLRWILDKNTVLYEADRLKKEAAEIEKKAAEIEKRTVEIEKRAVEIQKQNEEKEKQNEEKEKQNEEKEKQNEEKQKQNEEKQKQNEEKQKQNEEKQKQNEEKQKQIEERIARTVKGLATSFNISDISKMLELPEDKIKEILK